MSKRRRWKPPSRTSPRTSWSLTKSQLVVEVTRGIMRNRRSGRPTTRHNRMASQKRPMALALPHLRLDQLQLNKTTIPQKFNKMRITRHLLYQRLLNHRHNLQSKKSHSEGVRHSKIINRHSNRDLRKCSVDYIDQSEHPRS